jgi:hypothetical protein
VVAVLVTVLLVVRTAVVPKDFGIGANGYIYGWHRPSNELEWKQVTPKFQAPDYCKDCHAPNWDSIHKSPHANINCQNCHGPALNHPENPQKLTINRDRSLCLRCHAKLPYATSGRAMIRGIDPQKHNPGIECATCHNPHHPNLGGDK